MNSDDILLEKLREAGVKDPTPTSGNVDLNYMGNGGQDFLKLLENVFFTPMMSLLEYYLKKTNGTRKTNENCFLEFRTKHPSIFKLFFGIDLFFRLIYMSIVFIVVIRGLAIVEYFIQLRSSF